MYPNSRLRPARPQVKKPTTPKWPFIVVVVVVLLIFAVSFFVFTRTKQSNDTPQADKTNAPSFDKTRYSLNDPTSPWLVVNKKRQLDPKNYTPATLKAPDMQLAGHPTTPAMQVNAEAADALTTMDKAAQAENIDLVVVSGYRSYESQRSIYDSEVRGFGQAQADRESARPGHSEHQTGWAVDLGAADGDCRIEACFADTPEGKWLAKNAYKYGFVIRYAEDKEPVTGYNFEPWHMRYVGVDLATEMHNQHITTLEEFFGLPAAPTY